MQNKKKIIGFLCSMVLCAAIAIALEKPQMASSSDGVAIDATNFPDSAFREYVTTEFDKDANGTLSEQEIENATKIDVFGKDITSLKGVEYFTALTYLDCAYNQLTTLNVSNNTALTSLDCAHNQLTTLNVSNNTALTFLDCGMNQLKALDLSNNTALTSLDCAYNKLTALDVSNNTALTKVKCAYNKLTALDVSNNTALTSLDCSSNQLTALDASNATALTELQCSGNQLLNLNVSNNTALTELRCGGNQRLNLNVSKNTALTCLDCPNNQLTALDVSNNTALTTLECSENQLTSLDVSNNTALTTLNCYNNQLTSIDISKNTALTTLSCFSNQLTSIDISKNTALTSLGCSSNQLTSIDISKNTALTSLDCGSNQLTSLDLSNNTALAFLGCFNNQLTSLDLRNNTALISLRCYGDQLTELKLNSQTYDTFELSKDSLLGSHGLPEENVTISDLQNATDTDPGYPWGFIKVTDPTKPASFKVNGKVFTIIYADPENPDSEEELDPTPAEHFYVDYEYKKPATNSTICIYANGANVAEPGSSEKKNYRRCVLYTDITASYIYTVNNRGVLKTATGRVVAGITSSDAKPKITNGRIVDKEAAKTAYASIRNGQITVTARNQPGKVWLWVIDTGKAGTSACIPVKVKAASTATALYAVPDTDEAFGQAKQYKSGTVNVDQTIKVYLHPYYKQGKTAVKAPDARYTAYVDAKSADYFSVSQSADSPFCFEIRAKGLNNGKSMKGRVIFRCRQNGRTVVFRPTAINQVKSISIGSASGLKLSDFSASIQPSASGAVSGTFQLQTECMSANHDTTERPRIYAMGSADGYDAAKLEKGKVKITKKLSAVQKKISMNLQSDKKTVTVRAAKRTATGTTTYFLIVYNTKNADGQKGYEVVSITAE